MPEIQHYFSVDFEAHYLSMCVEWRWPIRNIHKVITAC